MADWFARPVLHVSSVDASLRFYLDRLCVAVAWRTKDGVDTRLVRSSAVTSILELEAAFTVSFSRPRRFL